MAILTQRHTHAPLTLAALDAGVHVYCAVPIAISLEEIEQIVSKVKQSGLVYMNGETSYYYPGAMYARLAWAEGRFGDFVYSEGEYYYRAHAYDFWMRDEYEQIRGGHYPGVITGKPVGLGGSLGRTEATGYGATYFAQEMLAMRGESLKGKTVAVSGSGNVAQFTVMS